MGDYNNQNNDPQTGDSNSAQNAGNATSQQNQQDQSATGQSGAGYGDQGATGQGGQQADGGFANDDESRGGPPTGENVDDTGGLTSDEGARTGQGGMQQDALGSAAGSEMDENEESDTLQDQNSSGAV